MEGLGSPDLRSSGEGPLRDRSHPLVQTGPGRMEGGRVLSQDSVWIPPYVGGGVKRYLKSRVGTGTCVFVWSRE